MSKAGCPNLFTDPAVTIIALIAFDNHKTVPHLQAWPSELAHHLHSNGKTY